MPKQTKGKTSAKTKITVSKGSSGGIKKYDPGKNVPWHKMDGRAQPGWETPKVTLRPQRSFGGQRETQTMRHVARQLFPYLKSKKSSPVEIQMMWANGSLFIGTNKDTPTRRLAQILDDPDELETAFGKVWGKSGETHDRTKRSVLKLQRLQDLKLAEVDVDALDVDGLVDMQSCMEAQNLFHILLTQPARELHCKDKKSARAALRPENSGRLYYVIEGNNLGRHIEEKFIDVLEAANYTDQAFIAGVKRPCGTCWIRLTRAKSKGFKVEFSPYPGQIWKGQAESLGLTIVDLDSYVQRGTFRSGPGGVDYDSGSDSDGEDELF